MKKAMVLFLTSLIVLMISGGLYSNTCVSHKSMLPVGQAGQLGTKGLNTPITHIQFYLLTTIPKCQVAYRVHVANQGWRDWAHSGFAGSTGGNFDIQAIEIKLENCPSDMHVAYQAHVQNVGWMAEVADGAVAGTTGRGLRLEALNYRLYRTKQSNPKELFSLSGEVMLGKVVDWKGKQLNNIPGCKYTKTVKK